jgi:hypothetical protein
MKSPRRTSAQRLATQAMELTLATPQVMAHRLTRMAMAGPLPSARDQREFNLMGQEKVQAFQQSWAAMWMQALATPMQPAKVLAAGMAPVHTKAVANARRLGKAKPR